MKTEKLPSQMRLKPYISPAGPPLETLDIVVYKNELLDYFVKPMAKILVDLVFCLSSKRTDTHTSKLSHVHISPQESPVMLTSPKRRYDDQFTGTKVQV